MTLEKTWKQKGDALANLMAAIGSRLRIARVKRGLSQEEISFRAGLHKNYLSDLELGKRNPTIKVLHKLSKTLGMQLPELVKPSFPRGQRKEEYEHVFAKKIIAFLGSKPKKQQRFLLSTLQTLSKELEKL